MKLTYLLLPTLGLMGCAGHHPESAEPAAVQQCADENSVPDSGDIRESSRVHTYLVNDYIDPNNPRLRHRGHLVDAIEQDEKWNLAPSDSTRETNLGPVTTVNDPNAAPNPYSAEFETELTQQRDQYRKLAGLGAQMTAELGKLQDMTEKSADAVSENAILRNRLDELQQEIDTVKPASPPIAPDAPKKPSWLDSILDLFRQAPHGTPVAVEKRGFSPHAQLRPDVTNEPPDPFIVPPPTPTNAADDQPVPDPGVISQSGSDAKF